MKNYIRLENICDILKFFYNDTFKGIFNRPFFRSKINKYGLMLVLFFLYIGYFYLNMIQLSNLSNNTNDLYLSDIVILSKMTLSSYYNLTLIISVFIFIFVKSTIGLTRNSLFIIKSLPFTIREAQLSIKIFKISIATILFEFILIIVAPALKLIQLNIIEAIIVLISLHTVFIASFSSLDLLYKIVLRDNKRSTRFFRKLLLDLGMISITIIYFMFLRFKIDTWVSELQCDIFKIISIILSISVLLILLVNFISDKYFVIDDSFIEVKFFTIKFPRVSIYLNSTISAFIRNINFLYLGCITISIILISIITNGIKDSLQVLLFLLPGMGIYSISYADATMEFRKMYNFYGIKPVKELKDIILVSFLLTVPTLFIGIIELRSINPYLYAITIFISSTIIGFLFPKSKSNINETISGVLVIIIFIILSLLANINGALIPSLIFLILILYLILKKEYEVTV